MQKRLAFSAAAMLASVIALGAAPTHLTARQRDNNRGPSRGGRKKFKGYMRKGGRRK